MAESLHHVGDIAHNLHNHMTGSWKTTVIGSATAFFAFVLFSPETFIAFPWLIALSKFAVCGGLAGLGIAAADFNRKPPEGK